MRGGETNVEVLECTIKECSSYGMYVDDGATVVATRCDFMENGNGYCGVDERRTTSSLGIIRSIHECLHSSTGSRVPPHTISDDECVAPLRRSRQLFSKKKYQAFGK